MPRTRASNTPVTLDIPLSTVTISVGERVAANATISGVNPYPNSNRFGTRKSTDPKPQARALLAFGGVERGEQVSPNS